MQCTLGTQKVRAGRDKTSKEKSLNRQRQSMAVKLTRTLPPGSIVSQLSSYLPQKKKQNPFLQIHMLLMAASSFLLKHTVKMTSSGVRLLKFNPPNSWLHQS